MSDTLWAWQVFEDGQWGTIAGEIPGMTGPTPLVVRSLHMAHLLGPIAVAHHDRTGLPVRRARFELAEVEIEMP